LAAARVRLHLRVSATTAWLLFGTTAAVAQQAPHAPHASTPTDRGEGEGAGSGPFPCSAAVHRWVAAASASGPAVIRPERCPGARIVLRIDPPSAPAYAVEVSDCGKPAFRRSGSLCLQPLMEVADFSTLPAAQREAFEQLARWIDRTPHAVVLPSPLPTGLAAARALDPSLGGAPVPLLVALFAALVAAWLAARGAAPRLPSDRAPPWPAGGALPRWLNATIALTLRPAPRRWRVPIGVGVALGVVAATLRFAFGAFDLHHHRLGVLWVSALVVDASELVHYGPGYVEILGGPVRAAVAALDLRADQVLFAVCAALGALLPPLMLAVARAVGLPHRPALAASLVAACDPVAVRFAASEAYHNVLLILSLGTTAAVVAAVRLAASPPLPASLVRAPGVARVVDAGAGRRRERWANAWMRRFPAVCCVVAAAGLVTQGVRVHPAGWGPLALAPLVGLAAPAPAAFRWRWVTLTVATIAGSVLLVDGGVLTRALDAMATGELFHGGMTLGAGSLMALGLTVASLTGVLGPARALGAVAGAHLLAWWTTRDGFGQSELWRASYDWLYLPVPLLYGAALVSRWVPSRRSAALVFCASLALWVAGRRPLVAVPEDTTRLERRELAAWLGSLPADCRVVHVAFVPGDDLLLPTYAAPHPEPRRFLRLDARGTLDVPRALGEVGCSYYVHTSLCATPAGAEACAAAQRQLVLESAPVFERWLPALPRGRYGDAQPSANGVRVPVRIFRIRGVTTP
jgi:hypothetical protein